MILWIVIKIESKGPGFFFQQRVGKDGKTFRCVKFRTMEFGTKSVGTHELSNDSITRVGRFLRKTKVDELPQIWNIVKNEMSLIGPRPCLPIQGELISERKKRQIFKVKPGITGWAQIQNIDMSTPVLLAEEDYRYLSIRSLLLEIKILLKTAKGNGQGDKITH